MNISSAIVNSRPGGAQRVWAQLEAIAGVEVRAASPEGRFVISIESADDATAAVALETIGQLDGVLAVSLVYCHFEADPDGDVFVEADPRVVPQSQGDQQ
jgi:nitrate reductase NapD